MEYKWKALSVTSVGALMAAVDSTVVLLALLPIAEELRSDFVSMVWVVIAYILVNTSFVLSLGRIGDMYGRKRMYNLGFAVFTVGSVLCGISANALMLVGFRAVQGFGAALLTANSFAILTEAFPARERGRAFGVNAIVWGVGSILGIVIGGFVITFTSWRLIFWINLPVGIFGTYWAYRTLHASARAAKNETFDLPAAVFFTLGLLFLLLAVTWGLLYSWTDPLVYAFFVAAPLALAAFVIWEVKFSKDPIVDFSMFRNRVFTLSITTASIQSLALFSVDFLLVFYLEGLKGLDILTASYLIVPMAAMVAITGPFGGMLSDRIGARIVATLGLAVQALVLIFFSFYLTTTTPLVDIGIAEAIYGIGGGLFWPANTSTIMSSAPPRQYGVASGVMNTFRNTGMVLSFALSLVAATSVIPARYVYQLFIGNLSGGLPTNLAAAYLTGQSFAFEVSIALLAVAAVVSLVRGRLPSPTPMPASPAAANGGEKL
ncbi:MAG TPA: MFS transporter [Thermoplasmata archaeon]|nr:MFS transporter [Thermoplasmata archaeon]